MREREKVANCAMGMVCVRRRRSGCGSGRRWRIAREGEREKVKEEREDEEALEREKAGEGGELRERRSGRRWRIAR